MADPVIVGIGLNLTSLPDGRLDLVPPLLSRWKALGCTHVEVTARRLDLVVGGRLNIARTEAVAEMVSQAGLQAVLHANHGINLMDVRHPEVHVAAARASIEAARRLGAHSMVLHSGHLPNDIAAAEGLARRAAERDQLRRLGDQAAAAGVRIALENLIANDGRACYGAHPEALAEQIVATDHPALGACMDFGHAWLSATSLGFDYLAAMAALSEVTWHLHLHDNCGRPGAMADGGDAASLGIGDMHAPIFDGSIPWEALWPKMRLRRGTFGGIELAGRYNARAAEIVSAAQAIAAYFNDDAALPTRPKSEDI